MSTGKTMDFDPSVYPRTYGISLAGKWFLGSLGSILIVLNLGIGAVLLRTGAASTPAVLVAACGAIALLCAYVLALAFFYRVVLRADSIEVFEIYRRRLVARSDIEGRRFFSGGAGQSRWVLVPRSGISGKISLSTYLKVDADFLAWIRSLPNLDEGQRRSAEQAKRKAIEELKARGVSERAIRNLRRSATGLSVACYVLGFAGFLVRDQHHTLTWILIAMPWVAIAIVAKYTPYARFGGARKALQPDFALALIGPGFFLSLQVLRAIAPVGWQAPLLLAFIGSVLLAGAAYWCDSWLRDHRGTAFLLLLLCCAYGYGAGMQVNALLDGSTPQTYTVLVTGKHVSSGRSTSYHLNLAQWGPSSSGQDLMVPWSVYARTRIGDTVCMVLRSGALGVAWSERGECQGK